MQRNGWCYGGTAAREPWHICTAVDQRAQVQQNVEIARGAEVDRREALEIRQMRPKDRTQYRIWLKSYGPCRREEIGTDCSSVDRSHKALNNMAGVLSLQ
jgi:hypothetical protein